jgi:hypothetical protein
MVDGKIIVSLKAKSGERIEFTLGLDKCLMPITAAVACTNMYLSKVFDLIGLP